MSINLAAEPPMGFHVTTGRHRRGSTTLVVKLAALTLFGGVASAASGPDAGGSAPQVDALGELNAILAEHAERERAAHVEAASTRPSREREAWLAEPWRRTQVVSFDRDTLRMVREERVPGGGWEKLYDVVAPTAALTVVELPSRPGTLQLTCGTELCFEERTPREGLDTDWRAAVARVLMPFRRGTASPEAAAALEELNERLADDWEEGDELTGWMYAWSEVRVEGGQVRILEWLEAEEDPWTPGWQVAPLASLDLEGGALRCLPAGDLCATEVEALSSRSVDVGEESLERAIRLFRSVLAAGDG